MQSSNSNRFSTILARASVVLSVLAFTSSAHAALERSGPVSNAPTIGGYPVWYQDTTGMALDMCAPNQAELDGGWCLLGVGDTTVPEVFPTTFADEHFYYAADAALTTAQGSKALVRLAVEAAFATAVQPGDQMVFSRIRVKLVDVPATGNYRFIHPYGEENIFAEAGAPRGIFFTDDVGLTAGNFNEALTSRLGPFLAASATPGGLELPAVSATNPTPDTDPAHFGGAFTPTPYPGTGKSYLADPARVGPITGSPLPPFIGSDGLPHDHNVFRIEGPAGSAIGGTNADGTTIDFIETTDFTLMGRVFADAIPGRVAVDRASYTNSATAKKLDVFASGFETTQGRLPTFPRPAPVKPQLSYFAAPCDADAAGNFVQPAGQIEQQMIASGTNFWAQSPLPATIPAAVCVKDSAARNALGQLVPAFFQGTVADEVAITQALFNPATRTLTVNATSSDTVAAPTLTLEAFNQPLSAGTIAISGLDAPPAKVRVSSSAKGSTELMVSTNAGNIAPAATLTAVNDSFTIVEDSGAVSLTVLANDIAAAGGTVTLASQPRLGTASVNADGSVTYTPNANAFGADNFTYQVTVGTTASNIGNVTINITAVNDAPTAVNDGPFTVNSGVATALPSLIQNDLDADGATDIVGVAIVSQPVGATATVGAGGVVTFNAAAAGTYTFTYSAVDSAGAQSANVATVTVNAVLSDTVIVSSALFKLAQKRWVVTGSSNVPNQTISLTYDDGSATGHEFGVATVDALGAWTLDIRGVTGLDDPTTVTPVQPKRIRATSSLTGSGTVGLTIK
ncbi:MAG: cadherin-like domain-containing protein [Myxococcales bacterium]